MNQTSVSYEGMRTSASNIMSNKNEMNNILNNTKTKMNDIESVWQSEAERTLKAQFDSMATKFQGFVDAVEAYSKFITTSVDAYETADKKLQELANSKLSN